MILLLIASLKIVSSQTAACSTYNSGTCNNSGYCYYATSTCISAECYKVTDIRACRSGGALATLCKEITSIDPNF